MYSIHSKIQIQILKPNNTQKSQKEQKKGGTTYLPTYLLYKRKKKVNSGLTYLDDLPLPLTLPYTTVQGKGKERKAVVPDKRNFPSNCFV